MSDFKKHWVFQIVPVLLFFVGVIMMTVGGTITLSSSVKLALFEDSPRHIITKESCRYEFKPFDEKEVEKTETEIERCFKEKKMAERLRFRNNQKQNIVEGLSSLFIGLILTLFFRKKKK